MASAAPPREDLTRCAICKEIINQPKALQCLHTFCLECLREWSQRDKESVTCPVLSCKKTTPMPSDGVDGLPGNVFVASLIENSPTRSKKVPCVCCEEKENVVMAKCLDCNGFLCQEGFDMHKKPFLRSHQVITLEDIKNGKVDLKKLSGKRKPTCSKHEGQPMWFFCETCQILICRDCTVVNHRNPEHKYVELESVVAGHKKKLEKLVKENEVVKAEVEKSIQETKNVRQSIGAHMKDLTEEIDRIAEQFKRHVDEVCCAEKERMANERADFESTAGKELDSAEESLNTQKESLQTALNMANQVLQAGSDYDIASVYRQISSVLEKNSQIKPVILSGPTTNLPEFFANPVVNSFRNIGNLRQSLPFTSCIFEGKFGGKDAAKEPGTLGNVRGIATTSEGDIAIANLSLGRPVKVYSINGKYKFNLDKQSVNAWDVATSSDGRFFVTTFTNKFVTVYGSDGHFQSKFAAVSPAGVSSDAEDTELKGITVSITKNQVIIGEIKKKYISIHSLNGVHCSSIPLKVAPHYIVTTRHGTIVVSSNENNQGVQILDCSGTVLHTINAPEGVSKWHPVGVCYNSYDDIYVFNRGSPVGIYRFSSSGSLLGCVNKAFTYSDMCGGLTFSQDEERLLVADCCGDIYSFQRE
ncbi:E3 ubiquitin-protein ligase TRIM56-like [Amphiura filiformis]|uniref:E3 ubiquitin-protein ligase TRIM56-like n=1 Tax=Amphiura filiformis TaxID=82378 RepID=UPI003B21F1B2